MNKKLEYLKKVARPIKTRLAKMADLDELLNGLIQITDNLEEASNRAKDLYQEAATNLQFTVDSSNDFIEEYANFEGLMSEQWDLKEKAAELASEIETELYDLGVEPSPELENYFSVIAEAEEKGQKAFTSSQDDYEMDIHNQLVDISKYN